jgi:hypothetical protein
MTTLISYLETYLETVLEKRQLLHEDLVWAKGKSPLADVLASDYLREELHYVRMLAQETFCQVNGHVSDQSVTDLCVIPPSDNHSPKHQQEGSCPSPIPNLHEEVDVSPKRSLDMSPSKKSTSSSLSAMIEQDMILDHSKTKTSSWDSPKKSNSYASGFKFDENEEADNLDDPFYENKTVASHSKLMTNVNKKDIQTQSW